MTAAPLTYRLFAGVDVAATSFAARWTTGGAPRDRAVTFTQTPDGFSAFQKRLCSLSVPASEILVVIEATGS